MIDEKLKELLSPRETIECLVLEFFSSVDKYLLSHSRNDEVILFKYFKLILEEEFKSIKQDRKDGKCDCVSRYEEYIFCKKEKLGNLDDR